MKLSSVIALILLTSASAFAPSSKRRTSSESSALSMARNSVLDGSLAGDRGFDPLGFSKDKPSLLQYREAEVKHARLAMLAAVGWPMSELFNKKLAAAFNLPAIIDETNRAPSIPNGGLGKISPVFWVACILAASLIEIYGLSRTKKANYLPGDLGFDPLGLYPRDAAGQRYMQLAEIRNGRLAMVAITSFAIQEYITKLGVVKETPAFFKPVAMAMEEFANQGHHVSL